MIHHPIWKTFQTQKTFWSKHKSDTSFNNKNISNNKTSWSNLKSDSSYNIKNNSSNNKSNNTDRSLIDNKKDIATEGKENQFWNIICFAQIKAIEYNHLRFYVSKG